MDKNLRPGCVIMIIPAIIFLILMFTVGDVGPIEGTMLWIIFFIGFVVLKRNGLLILDKPPISHLPPTSPKFVLYEVLTDFCSKDNREYPVVKFPRQSCVVRSHRLGSVKRRGYKDPFFQGTLEKYLGNYFEISGIVRLNTGENIRPYEPDISIIDNLSGLNIRIDIEIDEPYAGFSRQATHCIGEDDLRDLYFNDRGWIVIRFSEYQVHIYEKECITFICKVIKSVLNTFLIPVQLINIPDLKPEKKWDLLQAQEWERIKYRENYLNHEFDEVAEGEDVERTLSDQEKEEEELVEESFFGEVDKIESGKFTPKNKPSRDSKIRFEPESHAYKIEGVPAPSVSNIVSKFFNEFNADAAIDIMGTNHPLYNVPRQEIKKIWDENGKISRDKGTFLHQQIENYLLGKGYKEPEAFSHFLKFIEHHKDIKPYRTEWKIFDEKHLIAGTIDLVSRNGAEFDLYDWKRSKKIVCSFNGQPIETNPFQKGIGVLSHIDDTSYNRYVLQQSLYKYILETNYKIKINQMFLIVLHPNYNTYYKVKVTYWEKEIKDILKSLD